MKDKIEILVITNIIFTLSEENQKKIKEAVPQIALTVTNGKEVTTDMISKAEIIFGWLEEEQLSLAKNLKWLHLPSAGADGFTDTEAFCNKDIRVTTSSGVFGMPIAEHVFAMILAHNRNLQEYAYRKTTKDWHRKWEVKDFFGSTIGILGLGDIGTEIAQRAKAWGATVLAVKRTLSQKPDFVDQLYSMEELDEVLKQSDYLVLALPNTDKTRNIINEEKLRLMKPEAFLVNIGRGVLVDQEALIRALSEGWIAGAGLDVTEPEPLPQDSPLWELENVILTPHTSGGSPTNETRRMNIFYRNLISYMEGNPLMNQVDFVEKY